MLIKFIRGLIWAGLNSEVFILQGSSIPARFQSARPYSMYNELNIASTLYQPAILILIWDYTVRTEKKFISDG